MKQSHTEIRLAGVRLISQGTLRKPSFYTAFQKDEIAIGVSKGVASNILVFVSIIFNALSSIQPNREGFSFLWCRRDLPRSKYSRFTESEWRSHPSFAVNILWLLSLVLSVGTAFSASMVQQWAEQSSNTYQTTGTPKTTEIHQSTEDHQRTDARQITEISETRQTIEAIQTTGFARETSPPRPLKYWTSIWDHISTLLILIILILMQLSLEIAVFSFFAGLVVYVWNIHTIAGHFVLGFVCFFIFCYQTAFTAIKHRRHKHQKN